MTVGLELAVRKAVWQLYFLFLMQFTTQHNTTYRDGVFRDRLGFSGKFVGKSKKLPCLEITSCRYSTVQCYGL
jgi:hypothetical protein